MTATGARSPTRLAVDPEVLPVVLVPDATLSTHVARGLLPELVPHADAAFNAGRAALLVHALTAEPGLLLEATEDRLHQRQRAAAMPESLALVDRLRADGHAAVVSGGGPERARAAPSASRRPGRRRAGASERCRSHPGGWTVLAAGGRSSHGATVSRPCASRYRLRNEEHAGEPPVLSSP